MKFKETMFFITFLLLIVFVSFHNVLGFSFWMDDWAFYWGAVHNDRSFLTLLLHPGTVAEFVVLGRLFGLHIFWWNVFGLILKILASISVYRFLRQLTKSERAAKISAVLYAATPIGLEGVAWVSGHVVQLDTIFLCFAMESFIRYKKNNTKSSLVVFLLFSLFALLCDPIRTLPISLLCLLWIYLYEKKTYKKLYRTLMVGMIAALCIGAIAIGINRTFFTDSRIVRAFLNHGWNMGFYVQKMILVLQDPLSSLGNLFISFLYPTVDNLGMSTKTISTSIIGAVICLSICYIAIKLKRKKTTFSSILFFLLCWIVLFYLPNWIFAMFITFGFTNRYMVVSSVGFIGLIGYLLSRMPCKKWQIIIVSVLLLIQIVNSQKTLEKQNVYRSNVFHERLYSKINEDVPQKEKQFLFIVTGDHPIVAYSFLYNMQMPFVVYRNIPVRSKFPIFVSHIDSVLSYICVKTTIHSAAWQFIPILTPPSVSDTYAWRVNKDGTIESIHEEMRFRIQEKIDNGACNSIKPMIQ